MSCLCLTTYLDLRCAVFKAVCFQDSLFSLETYRAQASDKIVGNLVIIPTHTCESFAVCVRLGVCQEVSAISCTPMF